MTKLDIGVVGVTDLVGEECAGMSPDGLMAEASRRALEDAGLGLHDVDAIFCTSVYDNMPALRLAETLGLRPRYFDGTAVGGGSFETFVGHAAVALQAGLCDVALLAYGSTQRADAGKLVTTSVPPSHEFPFGMIYPVSSYALMAQRHMAMYGTTPEQLAEIAVSARKWAQLNPRAAQRDPLTVADVLASPMISAPLHRFDCCLVTDGAGAAVLTRGDRARDLAQAPVYVWGFAEALTHRYVMNMPDLTVTAAAQSGPAALKMAGVSLDDIGFAEIYDAFTIDVLMILEDLGYCRKGEGGPFVADGRIAPGGGLALNTTGGGLSYCHPGMFGIFLLVEAVRQLRREAGDRQVANAELGLVHGLGGVLSSGATVILGASRP